MEYNIAQRKRNWEFEQTKSHSCANKISMNEICRIHSEKIEEKYVQ